MKTRLKLLLLLLFFLIGNKLNAQNTPFNKVLSNTTGIEAFGLAATGENTFLLAGKTAFNNGALIWVDGSGEPLSAKSYSFGEHFVSFNHLVRCYDSSFVVAGRLENWSKSVQRAHLSRVSKTGELIWTKSIGLSEANLTATSVQLTADSGYILSGYIGNDYSGLNGLFAARLDEAGDLMWFRGFESSDPSRGFSATQTPDQGFLLSGYAGTAGIWDTKAVLIKTDSYGNPEWAKQYQQNENSQNVAFDAVAEADGYLCLTGNGLMKTDFSGNVSWFTNYGFLLSQPEFGVALPRIKKMKNGGYHISGTATYSSALYVLDQNYNLRTANGVLLMLSDLVETAHQGLIAVGNGPIYLLKNHRFTDPHIGLIRLDSIGSAGDCNFPMNLYPFSDTMTGESLVFNLITEATLTDHTAVISPLPVAASWGCIDVIGNLPEAIKPLDINILPNPVSDILRIESSSPLHDALVILYNIRMQPLIHLKPIRIDQLKMSSLPAGVYFLKITSRESAGIWKIIKK